MSERERWIVYPLLFLALGASLRDKLFNLTQSQKVVCESLAVFKDGDPRQPLALLGSERLLRGSSTDFIQVDAIRATSVEADHFVYRGRPLAEVMNQMPAVWRADLVRMLQGMFGGRGAPATPPAAAGQPTPPPSSQEQPPPPRPSRP